MWIKCPSLSKVFSEPYSFNVKRTSMLLMWKQFATKRKNTWISPGNEGALHDSTAWLVTQLVELLDDIKDVLKHYGLFFVEDFAYQILPHLIILYQNVGRNTVEDTFNYFLSNSHIMIKCVFGVIVKRTGILWQTLKFPFDVCCDIVCAATLLHNFVVDCWDFDPFEENYFKDFSWMR